MILVLVFVFYCIPVRVVLCHSLERTEFMNRYPSNLITIAIFLFECSANHYRHQTKSDLIENYLTVQSFSDEAIKNPFIEIDVEGSVYKNVVCFRFIKSAQGQFV